VSDQRTLAPEAVAGATTIGARSVFVTVIAVVANPRGVRRRERHVVRTRLREIRRPAEGAAGVRAVRVNVAPVGSGAAARVVIASPSGSLADTVK